MCCYGWQSTARVIGCQHRNVQLETMDWLATIGGVVSLISMVVPLLHGPFHAGPLDHCLTTGLLRQRRRTKHTSGNQPVQLGVLACSTHAGMTR